MKFQVEVSAAIPYDGNAIVGVGSLYEGRQNHTAGGDAIEDQGIDIVGAEDHGEIGSSKSTNSMLGDDDFVASPPNDLGDGPEWFAEECLMLYRKFDCTKQCIARTHFRQPRAEAYLNVDYGDSDGTRMAEDSCGPREESVLLIAGINGNYADLAIHAQQDCARGINRKRISHSQAPFA